MLALIIVHAKKSAIFQGLARGTITYLRFKTKHNEAAFHVLLCGMKMILREGINSSFQQHLS